MGAYLPLPYVYEREGRQERAWDIYSRLLRDRIVFIGTPIDDYVPNKVGDISIDKIQQERASVLTNN